MPASLIHSPAGLLTMDGSVYTDPSIDPFVPWRVLGWIMCPISQVSRIPARLSRIREPIIQHAETAVASSTRLTSEIG